MCRIVCDTQYVPHSSACQVSGDRPERPVTLAAPGGLAPGSPQPACSGARVVSYGQSGLPLRPCTRPSSTGSPPPFSPRSRRLSSSPIPRHRRGGRPSRTRLPWRFASTPRITRRDAAGLAVLRRDEPNYTYMKDGQEAARGNWPRSSRRPVYIRTHNLLTSGDGTPALKWGSTGAYTEDAEGRPRYDWTILDRIFDTYKERGRQAVRPDRLHARGALHPAAALPAPLDAGRQGRRISTGWAYPPKDYAQVGRAGPPVGAALRRAVRPGRGRDVVLGGLERAEHRLLAGARPRSTRSSTTTPSTP